MQVQDLSAHRLEADMFRQALPRRNRDAHKGTFGSVALIGGDSGMVGAVLLAARAALLSGAGRVYVAALCQTAPSVDMCYPELMLRSTADLAQRVSHQQLQCAAIGMGLGQSVAAQEVLAFWLAQNIPLLLDADALNLIASFSQLANQVKQRQAETVITPHPGEAARLLGVSVAHVQSHRAECALDLAKTLHATCVLKGADSICAHHDGRWFINTSGNAGLASAGTGDVLSGIISGLMAQGLSGLEAAKLGVYAHGAAADALVARGVGPIGMMASEVALEARNVINRLVN